MPVVLNFCSGLSVLKCLVVSLSRLHLCIIYTDGVKRPSGVRVCARGRGREYVGLTVTIIIQLSCV